MEQIKEGDFVRVYFEQCPMIHDARVEYLPCATGDSWKLEGRDRSYVVNSFAYMEKLTDKEIQQIKNPPPSTELRWDE